MDPAVEAHYRDEVAERDRLGAASLERVRTWELLTRFLPEPPAEVLDVGGAAGVYALPLARAGYRVHLVDPIERHVEQAAAASAAQPDAPLAGTTLGDARALGFPDASADAVLLLGPLYHLVDAADRARALAEAGRVLRPGGLLAAAAISRFASTLDGLRHGWLTDPEFLAITEGALRDGVHRNPQARPGWFTTAYFHDPAELGPELERAGFEVEAVLAVEGPGFLGGFHDLPADPAQAEAVLGAVRRLEAEPALLGVSPHLLAFARRPART
jgi:SAM-dependent methyltransferase